MTVLLLVDQNENTAKKMKKEDNIKDEDIKEEADTSLADSSVTDYDEDMSEYEKMRQQNIQVRFSTSDKYL